MFRRPHSVLAALLTTATVVTLVLGWFGWRMLQQESAIQRERRRERLESGADAMAAKLNGKLAESAERLSGWLAHPETPAPEIAGAVVFAHRQEQVQVAPHGALPYVPILIPSRPAGDLFAAAETLEANAQPGNAAVLYGKFSQHPDKHIRAGALLRLGRVLRKSKDLKGAMMAYQQLSELKDVLAEGYPAELLGLDGQRLAYLEAGDRGGAERVGVELAQHLDNGRWLLPRGMAEYFRDEVTQLAKPESWLLAGALSALREEWQDRPPDGGLRAMESGGRRVVTLWRANAQGSATLAAFPENMIPGLVARDFAYQLVDSHGKLVSGVSAPPPQTVARVIGDSWILRVWPGGKQETEGGSFGPTAVLPMMAVAILFLWLSVYFLVRAIRREAAVATLQTDFVATVSHEFRTPLTTLRQLSEMLEMGQVPSEERRQMYYRVLAKETRRLQRLVETLLDFGRMEAGGQRYRMQQVDVAELVRQVAGELGAESQERSGRVELRGPQQECRVLADPEALARALRNLVDNAMKYSPADTAIRIDWGEENGRVSIRVADRGPGIDTAEREVVFRKFVRGRAAAEGNVKGTGVGLAMVRQILAAHGGVVLLESALGHGSTFTLMLPARD